MRGRGSSEPPRATPPERAESCAMPAKNGRGLDEQDCVTPSWRHSRREVNHEALPGSPPNTTGELPLCDDKLLTKKRVPRPVLRGGERDPRPSRKRTEESRSRVRLTPSTRGWNL